ncbi:TonB-dependent receptor [Pacificimonas sp. ICDLI1SI03]
MLASAAAIIGVAAIGSPAFAQSSQGEDKASATAEIPPAAEPAGETVARTDGNDIIVTARRRAERLQDVPIAVSALSSDELTRANITQVSDIQLKVPGLTMTPSPFGSNILQVAIRGQRQFDAYITKDPAVAVYFADVVQNRPQGLNAALFDIESVQVLKGPQGTLFGRNTTGGAVIITPVEPKPVFGGYVTAGLGNYDAKRLEGAINIPLTDDLAVRAAGSITRRDGFTRNYTTGQRLDDDHKNSWRISALWMPGTMFENRLVLNGFEADENGTAYKLYAYRPGSLTETYVNSTDPGGLDRELDDLAALPFHSTLSNEVLSTKITTFTLSNVSELSLGNATLKNIFGYRRVKSNTNFDLEGSRYDFFSSREDMQERQYSNEIQLLGTAFQDRLDYIVGAFYFYEKGSDYQRSDSFAGFGPLEAVRESFADPITNEAYSFFGQVTYRPAFVEGVSLTGGIRQNYDVRSLFARSRTNGICRLVDADVGGTPLDPCVKQLSEKFKKLTYTLSADWKVTDDVLVYLAHRKGYRTGGFNFGGGRPSELLPFRPEIVKDFELGLKSSWYVGNVRSRLNIAAYSQDYTDIQRSVGFFVPNTSPPVYVNSIINAASARIRGVEADITIDPSNYFELGGSVSYIDATYKQFTDLSSGADLSGSAFAGAPKWAFSANASWTLPLAPAIGDMILHGDVYHQSTSNYADVNFDPSIGAPSLSSRIPPFTLVNARVELADALGTSLSVAAFAKNLLDEEYIGGGTDITLNVGFAGVILGAPRTYGLEATYRF